MSNEIEKIIKAALTADKNETFDREIKVWTDMLFCMYKNAKLSGFTAPQAMEIIKTQILLTNNQK